MERPIYTARLCDKMLLSESAQCSHHLEFRRARTGTVLFSGGQFVSMLAEDLQWASLKRAHIPWHRLPAAISFDLCLHRVEGGFFRTSCADLAPETTMHISDGPHGFFVLLRRSSIPC